MFNRRKQELTSRQEDRKYSLFVPHISERVIDGVSFYAVRVRTGPGEYHTLTDPCPFDFGRNQAARDLRKIRQQMYDAFDSQSSGFPTNKEAEK